MKRKAKKKPSKKKLDLSKPIINIVGSKEDPCFGNHLVTDDACKMCGDAELCAILTAQRLNTERRKLSKKNTYRDEEDEVLMKERDAKIGKTIRVGKKMGNSDKALMKKLKRRFNLSEEESKKYIKNHKH